MYVCVIVQLSCDLKVYLCVHRQHSRLCTSNCLSTAMMPSRAQQAQHVQQSTALGVCCTVSYCINECEYNCEYICEYECNQCVVPCTGQVGQHQHPGLV